MSVRSLLMLLGFAVCGGPAWAEPPVLRVLTYNVHHGEGTDGRLDLERIAKVIKATSPDLVALQEIDRNTKRTGGVDQAATLAKLTGLHVAFGKAIDFGGGEYGLAVLSRFSIKAAKVHPLPGRKGQEARIVLATRVEPGGGLPPVDFLCTHFQHDDPETRAKQAAKVNELFGTAAGPLILAGDLNAVPDSEPIRTIGTAWMSATPAGAPRSQIDYVLFRPAKLLKVVEAKVIEETVASDHSPVLAVLEWSGK
jgi:endonuclease/exonuclease/phosphatase family metal-dependent hydrolase